MPSGDAHSPTTRLVIGLLSDRRQIAAILLAIATLGVLVALGVQTLRSAPTETWPGRVAVIGVDEANPRQPVVFLAVADPLRKSLVYVPTEAVVEIPGAGFLRAFHAYRLGGEGLVRATLARLFGVDVPFSAQGPGSNVRAVGGTFEEPVVAAGHEEDLREALLVADEGWPQVVTLRGTRVDEDGRPSLMIEKSSLDEAAGALGGAATKSLAEASGTPTGRPPPTGGSPAPASPGAAPSPSPLDPAAIDVEVLNAGRVELAATRTADALRDSGYEVVRFGDFRPQTREHTVVYHRPGFQRQALQVAGHLGGYPVEPIPPDLTTRGSVLVLLGHDARV